LLVPPLIITEAQLAEGFEVIDRALAITDAAVEKGASKM
jgi:4-aminobutyrate aminotransferase-like enzyme